MPTTSPNTNDTPFYFNGVNGATGGYLESPMTAKQLAAMAVSDRSFPQANAAADRFSSHFRDLNLKKQRGELESFGARFGIDTDKLEQAGWGVLFAQGADPRIVDALRPLLELRKN